MTRWIIVASIAVLPLGLAEARWLDIEELQRKIDAQGLSWTAGETDWSSLSRAELRQRLIPLERLEELKVRWARELAEDPAPPPLTDPDDLPRRFTWGDYHGHNFNTSIRDQGQCGSCMAFAYVAALEGLHLWRIGRPRGGGVGTDFDLSEQELLDCAQDGDDWQGCNGGSSFRPFDAYLKDLGLTKESCYPYEAEAKECRRLGCADDLVKISGGRRIAGWMPCQASEIERLKQEIFERPVPSALIIWGDFMGYSGGVYTVSDPGLEPEGAHALSIVGWDEDLRAFHVKNSWGRWGEDGFGWVGYCQAGIGSGAYRIEYMEDQAAPELCDEFPESLEFDRSRPDRFRMIRLQNCGSGQALDWTISADADWLQFAEERGLAVVGTPHDLRIDPVVTADTPASGDEATITITATLPGIIDPDTGTTRVITRTISVSVTDSGGGGGGGGGGGCAAAGATGGAGGLLLLAGLALRRRRQGAR